MGNKVINQQSGKKFNIHLNDCHHREHFDETHDK